jgi:hypothetical protein
MYRKTGICKVPRSRYIPQMCRDIEIAFGDDFDQNVAAYVKSLGNERTKLQNFFFEMILQLQNPKYDSNGKLRFQFLTLLADLMFMIGVIDKAPIKLEYRVDPVMDADELLDLMVGTRMPTFSLSDLGGDQATVFQLMCFMPEYIRRNALILHERPLMAQRFRNWLGDIGFKLLKTSHASLSQAERTFLVVAGCTLPLTKGFIAGLPSTPIPAVENKEPLVVETGALATASALPGPCTNHLKLISNQVLEQLLFYYGPHVSDLKSQVGYMDKRGPYWLFKLSPEDSIPWMLEAQITGLSAMASDIAMSSGIQPPFTIRTPQPLLFRNAGGVICLYEDIPTFNLWLTDPTDIHAYTWDFMSKFAGRRISSLNDGGTMDYALADLAAQVKTAGGMQIEGTEIPSDTLLWFDEEDGIAKHIENYDGNIIENYLLPSPSGLLDVPVNMTAYYARFGSIEVIPAFAEFLELPMAWFRTPAENVVSYVNTMQGLTLLERVRFADVITFCHNYARYMRITRRQPKDIPIDRLRYVQALLNINPHM